ncbi:MAG TPA: oxygenase MpaB family protein, partial [Gemmatimonadales bacterium]|nr:oxygenase MpaB family protein [Gemmatimonadales bacterium]
MPPASEWRSLTPHEGTITWRRAGDVRVLLAAGYALLLQVSHPTVGAGVSEHSDFQSDPWGRLLRTLDYSCTMVYAGPAAAGEMGARIRSFHKQI